MITGVFAGLYVLHSHWMKNDSLLVKALFECKRIYAVSSSSSQKLNKEAKL